MTAWRQKRVLIAAVVITAAIVFALIFREREPSYQGKSLTYWLLESRKPQARPEAEHAIRHIGTNALPFLLQWVRYDSPGLLQSLVARLPTKVTPWSIGSWANGDSERDRAFSAAFAFAQLGDDAQSAIPQLITAMTNSAATNASLRAIYALSSIGKAAIPALTTQIANTNLPNRRMLIHSFGYSPSMVTNAAYATAAVPLLVGCLDSPDPSIAASAISALGRMAVHDPAQASLALPGLTNMLQSDFPEMTRIWAAMALGRYGTSASNAVPTLLTALADRDRQVRDAATNALLKIDPKLFPRGSGYGAPSEVIFPTLPWQKYGTSPSNAVPGLVEALKDPDPMVRQRATNSLLQIAPWEITNFPKLVPMVPTYPYPPPQPIRRERP